MSDADRWTFEYLLYRGGTGPVSIVRATEPSTGGHGWVDADIGSGDAAVGIRRAIASDFRSGRELATGTAVQIGAVGEGNGDRGGSLTR